MLTAWVLLMLNSLFFTLRLSGGGSGGSFPRPLKAEEERAYLDRFANLAPATKWKRTFKQVKQLEVQV